MNEHDMMRAMNGIEEQFVSEYAALTPRKGVRMKRMIRTGVIIATAAAFAVPAVVYAYSGFIHRENVEHYITGADIIEEQSPDAVKNYVMENQDYCITIDSVLSDGHNVIMVLTHDAKSIKGLQIKDWVGCSPETYITYADGSAGPFEHTDWAGDIPMAWNFGGYAYDDVDNPFGFDRTMSVFDCKDIDITKDVKIEFFSDYKDRHSALLYYWKRDDPEHLKRAIPDFDFDEAITNDLDGMEFTTSFAPNVKCIPLYNADGTEIFMSAFEIYSERGLVPTSENNVIDTQEIFFITNDGEKTPLEIEVYKTGIHAGADGDYIIYGKFIDPDEYKGIEINGVEYLKKD